MDDARITNHKYLKKGQINPKLSLVNSVHLKSLPKKSLKVEKNEENYSTEK